MTEFYSTGTIAVAADSVDFVGTGTAWLPVNAKAGDTLNVAGLVLVIAEITDATHGKFAIPYPGASGSGLAYAIAKTSSEWGTNRTLALQTAEMIQLLTTIVVERTGIAFEAYGYFANRGAHDDAAGGFVYLSLDGDGVTGIWTLYIKETDASGDWDAGQPMEGAPGPPGEPGADSTVPGPEGDPGPANTLTIGTVDGGPVADAEITGEAPNQTLNLVLPQGADGENGTDGLDGWTPVLAVVSDGTRRVQQVIDWAGGEGAKPATGQYVGATGLTGTIGDAVDIRGPQGSPGAGSGDMQAATYDPQGIEDDAFDRSNHTGTQAIATVSGLQAALDDKTNSADLGTAADKDTGTASGEIPILDGSGKLDPAVIPGGLGGGDVVKVADRAALKAVDTGEFTAAILLEGGRRGVFVFDPSNLSPKVAVDTAEGIYVAPSSDTDGSSGAWVRDFHGPVDIRWFGAIGDGNAVNAAVNAAAVALAMALGGEAFIPWTAEGYHFGTNTLTVGSGKKIVGQNRVELFSTVANTNCFIKMTCYADLGEVENIKVNMAGAGGTGTTAIRFGTASGVIYRARIFDVDFEGCVEAIGDESHVTNYITDVEITNVWSWHTRGRQIYLRRSRGFTLLRNVQIDRTQDSPKGTWGGIHITDVAGLEMDRVDVVGPVDTTNTDEWAIDISGGAANQAVWLNRVFTDSTPMSGIRVFNIDYLWADKVEGNFNLRHQVYFYDVNKAQVSNIFGGGAIGKTGAAAGANGVTFDACSMIQANNVAAENCTGSGIVVTATTDSMFHGLRSRDNTFDGLYENGASNRNFYSGGDFSGNGLDQYDLIGTASVLLLAGAGGAKTVFATGEGINVAQSETVLLADFAGSNVNTAQPIFAAAQDTITLAGDTTYEFEAEYFITRAAGTTSHTTGILFGGTATLDSVGYSAQVTNPTGNALANVQQIWGSAAAEVVLTAANTSATENLHIRVRGRIRTNAAGTLIPQFKYSAAPGGAPTVKANSAFRIWPIGSDQVVTIGAWS